MGWFNEVTNIWIFGKVISIKNEYLVIAMASCLIIIILLIMICCCCCTYSRMFREAMTCGLCGGQSDDKEKRQKSGYGKRYRSKRKRRKWTEPLTYVSSFFDDSDRGYRGRKRNDDELSYSQSFLIEAKNEFQQRRLPNKVWPEFLRVYRYLMREKKVERDTATQAIYSVFYDQQQPYVQMPAQPMQMGEQEQQPQEQQYLYDPAALEQFKAKNQYLLTDIENMLKAYAAGGK